LSDAKKREIYDSGADLDGNGFDSDMGGFSSGGVDPS
jgi:DnaJ-class molecular chaperone